MARLSGVDIPSDKRIEASLPYIFGIGPKKAKDILEKTGIDPNVRTKNLTDEQVSNINKAIRELELPIEGELRRIIAQNIRRLIEIKSYRGSRHKAGLPVNGQRTRSNARTRKGKKKTVGGMKKKLAKK